ncbi:hypothetical protein CJ483_00550 [Bacillus sp. PK3_68]|nr:hypothetical protein CJ483_00550 [Bacillus sp. PK3_68]
MAGNRMTCPIFTSFLLSGVYKRSSIYLKNIQGFIGSSFLLGNNEVSASKAFMGDLVWINCSHAQTDVQYLDKKGFYSMFLPMKCLGKRWSIHESCASLQ